MTFAGSGTTTVLEEAEPLGQKIATIDPGAGYPTNYGEVRGVAREPEWQCMLPPEIYGGFMGMPTHCKQAAIESGAFSLAKEFGYQREENPKKISGNDSPIPDIPGTGGEESPSALVLAKATRSTHKRSIEGKKDYAHDGGDLGTVTIKDPGPDPLDGFGAEHDGDDYYKETGYPFLGNNPFPKFDKFGKEVTTRALDDARKVTAKGSDCDTALKEYGIESLNELVGKFVLDQNLFDGRDSTIGYPPPSNKNRRPLKEFFAKNNGIGAIASVTPLFTGLKEDVTFLNSYFFNPTSGFYDQQRALLLIHEAVHNFGFKKDSDFGSSRKLSEMIAEKCYPGLKATKLLGNVTL